jgi:hypothetical protein
MPTFPWESKKGKGGEAAERLKNSIDAFPEVQKQIQAKSPDIDMMLEYWKKTQDVFLPQKPTSWWVHFIFVPVIFIGVAGAGHVLREATTKDNQQLKQQALTVLGRFADGFRRSRQLGRSGADWASHI